MPLLYYWRPDNYARDRAFGFGYHLNQDSPAMAATAPGDSLWAFTRRRRDGLYVLAAELVLRAMTRNPPKYRYGAYRAWGDLALSRYFDVDAGANAEPLIRHLSVPARARHLGQAFQGHAAVRRISAADHILLAVFAQDQPVLSRVGIYPEDQFEARLIHGEAALANVVREEGSDYSVRQAYLYESTDQHRARRNADCLQELYRGFCQICLFDPRNEFGLRLCHGHHLQWLSRGGEDELENMILACPNHHAAIHRDDAPFDYEGLTFAFSNGRVERIRLNKHLPRVG